MSVWKQSEAGKRRKKGKHEGSSELGEALSSGWIREVIIALITGWAASLIRSQPTPDKANCSVLCNDGKTEMCTRNGLGTIHDDIRRHPLRRCSGRVLPACSRPHLIRYWCAITDPHISSRHTRYPLASGKEPQGLMYLERKAILISVRWVE